MRRIWLPFVVTLLLAACGTAPQQAARKPAVSASTVPRAYAPPSGFPNFVDHSVGREEISIQAMSLVGVPYRWGGNTPDAGFDCSGLVRYVVDRAASVNLPRTTGEMSGRGESIEPDEIATGDLVFFNTTGRPHSHVGIYVGKLRFVNAPSTGGTVRLDYLTNPYWAKRFDGIRRVAPAKAAPTPFDGPTYLASGAQSVTAAQVSASRPQAPVAAEAPPSVRQTATADAFEPPPASLSAAQRQSSAARRSATADAFEPPPASMSAAQRQAQSAVAGNAAPDPIQAAADAFEPPPPTWRAARSQAQAAKAVAPSEPAEPPVHIMRASTGSLTAPRPASTDDPIARFAAGSN
ncbi:C40 family peptidase [Caballeronia concitans]|uniref:Hydrolase Nlp/P60 n=1 Tax=Caballeronia concitans TaxID=1777133 RepID=A0A658QYH3_9BURK|nr:C40 family peptidase [Caballeronia concitans]KIG10523.1 NLP/P60 protein [Burkholderia sp. MR1]SAL33144.1 hydrolase Nlp/P60 [Caballeronia concitans]